MASLTSIFKDVLLTNESITVPGFGTFETSYQSAQLDEKTGVIYPPTKLVKFNDSKKDDADNKLVNFLKDKVGLSDEEAQKVIDEFVAQAIAKFADKAQLTIDEVGVLQKDEAGVVTLKSIPSNLSIDNYGMDTVEVEKVEEGQRVAAVADTSKGKQANSSSAKSAKVVSTTKTTKTTTTTTKTTTSKEEKKKGGIGKWLIWVLLLVAILTALFFIFKDKIMEKINGKKDAPIETVKATESPDVEVVDIEKPETVDIKETNPTQSDLDILAQAGFNNVSPQYLGNKYKKYYLVGGSFRDKQNANQRKRLLNAPEILKAEGSEYYRVIIVGSDNPQEIVDAYKASLDKGILAEDMWLLKNSK